MTYKIKVFGGWVLISLFVLFFLSCNSSESETYEDIDAATGLSVLDGIKSRGKLIAVTGNNSLDYFIYKGDPMGYQLEMAEAFANELGVKLEIIIESNPNEAIRLLEDGKADIIAMDLPITLQYNRRLDYAVPFTQTRLVLVQQKRPAALKTVSTNEVDTKLITTPLSLAGKTLYIPDDPFLSTRVESLMQEIGDTIYVVRMNERSSEELIGMVSTGEIEYTLAEERLAGINASIYSNLDISTPVSFQYHVTWAVKKDAKGILKRLNEWYVSYIASHDGTVLYGKYYKSSRISRISESRYYSGRNGIISDYDNLLRPLGRAIGWDWRMLASLIYQESAFKTNRTSYAGAFGIMQMMPATAEIYGIDSSSSPSQQIVAGVRYIQWLENQWKDIILDPDERLKFVLASYNVGLGHVLDARRLATKYGRNPNVWQDSVEFFLESKSSPEFYTDATVYYGYCMGDQPVKYVNEIIGRYSHYRKFYN